MKYTKLQHKADNINYNLKMKMKMKIKIKIIIWLKDKSLRSLLWIVYGAKVAQKWINEYYEMTM